MYRSLKMPNRFVCVTCAIRGRKEIKAKLAPRKGLQQTSKASIQDPKFQSQKDERKQLYGIQPQIEPKHVNKAGKMVYTGAKSKKEDQRAVIKLLKR